MFRCIPIHCRQKYRRYYLRFALRLIGTTACKWDSILPFDELWKEYERIIKPNGAIVLFGSQPFTSALIMSNPKLFRYEWIWAKNRVTNIFNAKKQPMKAHENICLFYKQQPTYNPIMEERLANSHNRKNSKERSTTQIYGDAKLTIKELAEKSYPKSVKNIDCVHPHSKEYLGHGTQKPVALFEYLVRTYSNENDLVLDNCAGSCTTAIAALNTNRNYICMEKEERYYNIGLKRVKEWHENKNSKLF